MLASAKVPRPSDPESDRDLLDLMDAAGAAQDEPSWFTNALVQILL